MNSTHAIFSKQFMFTPNVHDGSDGSEGHDIHVLRSDLYSNVVTLEHKSFSCLLVIIREVLARSKGKPLVSEEDFLTGTFLVIYPFFKQLDLEVLNPLSKLNYRKGGVYVDL